MSKITQNKGINVKSAPNKVPFPYTQTSQSIHKPVYMRGNFGPLPGGKNNSVCKTVSFTAYKK
eukprot:2434980-Rhodomonas_salina.1